MNTRQRQKHEIRAAVYRMQTRRARALCYRLLLLADWDDPKIQQAIHVHTGVDVGIRTEPPLEGQTELEIPT